MITSIQAADLSPLYGGFALRSSLIVHWYGAISTASVSAYALYSDRHRNLLSE